MLMSCNDSLIPFRMNRTLTDHLGLHKGLFSFMHKLKTTVFESSFNVMCAASAGRQEKHRITIAAQRLAERAADAEQKYAAGEITAAELLRLVACHYDDKAVVDLFSNLTDAELDDEVQVLDLDDEESGTIILNCCFFVSSLKCL